MRTPCAESPHTRAAGLAGAGYSMPVMWDVDGGKKKKNREREGVRGRTRARRTWKYVKYAQTKCTEIRFKLNFQIYFFIIIAFPDRSREIFASDVLQC